MVALVGRRFVWLSRMLLGHPRPVACCPALSVRSVEFPDSAGAAMRAQYKAAKLLKKNKKSGGFQSLGLSPLVYRGVMRLGYKVPTPIQRRALPIALSGKDLCAMARTGTRRTVQCTFGSCVAVS